MDIRMILKEHGYTLSEFANLLFLSRPTLNSYIRSYEETGRILDKRYQLIFDKLFSEKLLKDEFVKRVNQCTMLVNRNRRMEGSNLTTEKSDIFNQLVQDMRRDLNKDDANREIYVFIRMIINNYRRFDSIKNLCNYYLCLNNKKDFSSLSEFEKREVVYIYHFLCKDQHNDITLNYALWERKFLKRVDEIKNKDIKATDDMSKMVFEIIQEEMKRQISLGKNVDSITIEDILNGISKK